MTSNTPPDPIYVGYLPIPSRHKRFLRAMLPGLVGLGAVVAGAVALAQRDPGSATWQGDSVTISGTIEAHPYPRVLPDGDADGSVLLVSEGKHGSPDLADLDGRRAEVRGRLLERDGQRMLEIDSDTPPRAVEGAPVPAPPSAASLVTLRGEIVDSKCCLGAMKPGQGKTHRACATLCIRGGVPPILVSAGEHGEAIYTLLTGEDGSVANDLVLPYIAEDVAVTGDLRIAGSERTMAIHRIVRPAP